MQNRNFSLRDLKIARWPVTISWGLYFLGAVIIFTAELSVLLKIVGLLVVSIYLIWWQYRAQRCRFQMLSVITIDNSWILSDAGNNSVEADLTGSSQFWWGVVLHLDVKANGHCSVLVMRNDENGDTFRQLRSYLTHQLTH